MYTPAADFNGTDSFVVTINDEYGGAVQSTVNITVTPVADALDDTVTTNEDTPIVIAVNSNDSFESADHAVTTINGSAIAVGGQAAVANGTVTLNADGTLNFSPVANFNGVTSFTYTVTSGGLTETATVTVNVTAVNDPPTPQSAPGSRGLPLPGQTFDPATGNYQITTPEDSAYSGSVGGADLDGDVLSYTVATPPANGAVLLNPDGTYTYTPSAGFDGKDSFVVLIGDGNGGFARSTVFVTVTPLPDATQAARDDYPFVFQPYGNTFETAQRWDGAHIEVEPTLLQAVNGVSSLGGTTVLSTISGPVLQAVDGLQPLNGTTPLGADTAVLQAVNGADSLNGGRWSGRPGSTAMGDWRDPANLDVVSSFSTASGLTLELSRDRQQIWVSMSAGPGVREIRVTLANGGDLPPWVSTDGRGFLAIDRSADVEQLRLRLTVVPEKGAPRSQVIEFDFNSGQMRVIGSGEADRTTRPPGSPRADVQVPDFSAQLEAAARGQSRADEELMELLAELA